MGKTKADFKFERRIEEMRQITKKLPPKPEMSLSVFVLMDIEEGKPLGIFTTEEKAWNEGEALWSLYRIEVDVEEIYLDQSLVTDKSYAY